MARQYTSRTIKLLFARARRCAFPGCTEGLVLEDRDRLTVVAQIAHIRSEKPDGPRHEPTYADELINEEENLLLLCGKHHKPVDDHESVYPVAELLSWKREQTAAGGDLSEHQVERIFLHDDLNRLGPDAFEKMCQALTMHVLGPETKIFGGPRRGAEGDATFNGRTTGFPTHDAPWDGFIVMEAMYGGASRTLRHRIEREFERWASQTARGDRRPDYMIFATNLQLTADDPELGRLTALIDFHAGQAGLRGWRLWDGTQLAEFLDVYPNVRRAVGTISTANEIVAAVLAQLPTTPVAEGVFRPGEPGNEAAFQPAYEAAGGARSLGHALGHVQQDRIGWSQHFSGGINGEPAVLCARYGKNVVAVARAVWNDIGGIGGGIAGGGAAGIGFPVSGAPSRDGYIGSDAESIELAGGQWGPEKGGRLLRSPREPARWQPGLAFDSNASKDRDTWATLADQRDLRIRVAARIPLCAELWRISRRGRMLAAVDATGITAVFHALADQYCLEMPAGSWQEIGEPDGHNNSRFASYQITANDSDGRTALALCIRLTLPDGLNVDVHTTVDLRVDFAALTTTAAPPAESPSARRLTVDALKAFFVHAWPTATDALLLAATDDPLALPPAGAARLELHIQNEQLGHSDRRPTIPILDMVDFSSLGSPRGTGPRALSVGVTAALGLPADAIAQAVDDALQWMVEDAGFVTPEPT
ncbi:hypothetical protein ACQPXB_21955 [Amycolatopsis sp. CA-161197]|uniref:HNH endonuclease signature motif containing protein n=1 Tax=Amycolatopsis sp. CA-161197 TaxID=3239922 RepID=UPI003D916771